MRVNEKDILSVEAWEVKVCWNVYTPRQSLCHLD